MEEAEHGRERNYIKDLYVRVRKICESGVNIRLNNQPASLIRIVTAHMVKKMPI